MYRHRKTREVIYAEVDANGLARKSSKRADARASMISWPKFVREQITS